MKVLIIDDDDGLTASLQAYFGEQQITLAVAPTTDEGARLLNDTVFDAILLDVMLPDQSGFDFLPQLRQRTVAPILMLTALGEEDQRVSGLNLGADDYITKPFSARELVARLRASYRRQVEVRSTRDVAVDDLRLKPGQQVAYVGDRSVRLTDMECRILEALMRAEDHRADREFLHRRVFGRDFSPLDRSLDVHVSNLRKKLGSHPSKGERIRAIRGFGYLLAN
ncbi:MAG: response regulator transcription factor [Pseudomonadota bacterium]